MEGLSGDSFTIKLLNGESIKVNANDEEAYRSITKHLSSNNCLWHSYENKQNRPIRVVAKKLPATCMPERIIEDLQNKGFKIESAVNKLKWRNKEPLNMFMLTFKNEEDINKIFSIKNILGCNVEIHALKSPKLIPQCKRCQAYGHTQKYCCKEPRCVKCTGKHFTKECQKPTNDKPKCIHCGEPHPANYRGCVVAKELQKYKNKTLKKKELPLKQPANGTLTAKSDNHTANVCLETKIRTEEATYAQMVTNKSSSNNHDKHSNLEEKLDKILKYVHSLDERLQKIENSTTGAFTKKQQWVS